MTIRVVVADDQDLVRAGLVMILGAYPALEVVGEAADGIQALDLTRRLRPDVLLVDIRMPGLDGVEVTRRVAGPDVTDPIAVVVITTFDLDEYVLGALRAGARGYVLKDLTDGAPSPAATQAAQAAQAGMQQAAQGLAEHATPFEGAGDKDVIPAENEIELLMQLITLQ